MGQSQNANALMLQVKEHFGLSEEIFSESSGFFFEGAQRAHNLETIRHMACFTDVVLFLTGEKGAGKTSLLKHLESSGFEGLRVIYIDCESLLKEAHGRSYAVLHSCLNRFGLEGGAEDPKELFSLLLKACHRWVASNEQRTLLVMDNADKLPKKELLAYCGFCRDLSPESALVMLFSGSSALMQATRQGSNLEREDWWQQIHLKPLTVSDISDYLSAALKASGATVEHVLNDQQLQQLAELGKGLPGRINKFFPSVLLEPGSLKIKKAKAASNMPMWVMLGIAGLLVLSFLFVSYQHGLFSSDENFLNQQLAENEESLVEEDKQRLARLALLDKALLEQGVPPESNELNEDESSVNLDNDVSQSEADQLLSDSSAMETDEHKESELVFSPDNHSTLDVEESDKGNKDVSGDVVVQDLVVDAQNVVAESLGSEVESVNPVVATLVETKPHFKTKEWLLGQSKEAYMPQILGSYSEETATKFIKKIGKQKFEIFYLQTQHKGRSWFVVFYGIFPAKTHAQDAVKNSPSIIKSQKPWIRRVGEVLASYP